jgi:hypothetical protein
MPVEAGREAGFTPKYPLKINVRDIHRMIWRDPFGALFQVRQTGPFTDRVPINPKVSVTGPVIGQVRIKAGARLSNQIRSDSL